MSVKKQKHFFQLCFVDRARHRKIVEDKDSQNGNRSTKVAKELFAVYESNRSMHIYNTIITFGFCDIHDEQGLGKGRHAQASADNLYLDLDYSRCHRNFIQYFLLLLLLLLLLLFSFALNNLCEAPQIKLIMDTSVSATIGLWQQFCTLISCKVFIYKDKWRERWVDGKTDR